MAAVVLARTTVRIAEAANHRGTALPGLVAERVWPDVLKALAGQLHTTVLVIGTNGKTTTAGLIAEILADAGPTPIANRSGANMRQGILSSLVLASDLRGRLRPGRTGSLDAVFEVDEAALGQILPDLGRTVIVATNLFRDQLDRYGEVDAVVDRWAAALSNAADGSVLVHCADDPRLTMLAATSRLPRLTFGLAGPPTDRDQPAEGDDAIADPVACRSCGRQLHYAWRSIGDLGDFSCPAGHVRRGAPDVTFEMLPASAGPETGDEVPGGAPIRLTGRFGSSIATPVLPGLANAYNVAAAMTAASAIGFPQERITAAVDGYAGAFGRLERLEIDGRRVLMTLVKNTVSLAETARLAPLLAADVILLGLNDSPADGRDVSWIWDAPIATLVDGRDVVLTGSRATDLHLRLKYERAASSAPPRSITVARSLAPALDLAVARAPRGGVVVVAATYSAMLGLRAIAQGHGDAPVVPR